MNIYNFINSFDKVICLTRKNIFDSAISLTMAQQTEIWHKSYEIDTDWIIQNIDSIKKNHSDISHAEGKIIEFPFLQVTYENIYENKEDIEQIKNYLGIKKLKYVQKFLNSNLKYRKK